MINMVHRRNGTAHGIAHKIAHKIGQSIDYMLAGKTATVQTRRTLKRETKEAVELERTLRDHAMFIGFAPPSAPEIAISVVVEYSGAGSKYAAPVARKVLDAYFRKPSMAVVERTG